MPARRLSRPAWMNRWQRREQGPVRGRALQPPERRREQGLPPPPGPGWGLRVQALLPQAPELGAAWPPRRRVLGLPPQGGRICWLYFTYVLLGYANFRIVAILTFCGDYEGEVFALIPFESVEEMFFEFFFIRKPAALCYYSCLQQFRYCVDQAGSAYA